MAGYSGKPLVKKLGIKADSSVLLRREPSSYAQILGPLPRGVRLVDCLEDELDLVHVFVTKRLDLERDLRELRPRIKQDGVIWVSWPKKAAQVLTDITENIVRELALPLGLVDVKVCAVDETWSGLKLVIRKALRR